MFLTSLSPQCFIENFVPISLSFTDLSSFDEGTETISQTLSYLAHEHKVDDQYKAQRE